MTTGSGIAAASPSRERWILAISCFGLFMAQLDATAVNVALPSIGDHLDVGIDGLQWVINAYVVTLASAALTGGAAGDRFGRRRVYETGLIVFALGSLGCSLAGGLAALVASRVIQAIGASMLMPVSLSIITNTFTDARDRARAIGVWASAAGLAAAAGPVLGGALTALAGWRAIFWINLPVAAVALVGARRFLVESRAARAPRLDLVGQVLAGGTIALLTYAVIGAPGAGWGSARTLGGLAAAAAAAVLLLVRESRVAEPMIELAYFRHPRLASATAIAALGYFCLLGFLFLNTIYLQQVRGESPLRAGLTILPASAGLLLFAPVAGRRTARHGPRQVVVAALLSLAVSQLALTRLTPGTPLVLLLAVYLAVGTGWGLLNPPLTNAAVTAMPPARAGVASATVGASRQVGSVLGVAIMGSLTASAFSDGPIKTGTKTLHALSGSLTGALHWGFAAGAVAALAAIPIALRYLGRPAQPVIGGAPVSDPGAVWDARFLREQWSAVPDRHVLELARRLPPGTALDLGCGPGRNAIGLAHLGWAVTGVDASKVALVQARDRAKAAGAAVSWVRADLLDYQPPAGGFDLVLIANVHLAGDQRSRLFRMATDALAPGGRLIVVGHHVDAHGHIGPDDRALFYTERDLRSLVPTLRIERLERIARSGRGGGEDKFAAVLMYATRTT